MPDNTNSTTERPQPPLNSAALALLNIIGFCEEASDLAADLLLASLSQDETQFLIKCLRDASDAHEVVGQS